MKPDSPLFPQPARSLWFARTAAPWEKERKGLQKKYHFPVPAEPPPTHLLVEGQGKRGKSRCLIVPPTAWENKCSKASSSPASSSSFDFHLPCYVKATLQEPPLSSAADIDTGDEVRKEAGSGLGRWRCNLIPTPLSFVSTLRTKRVVRNKNNSARAFMFQNEER